MAVAASAVWLPDVLRPCAGCLPLMPAVNPAAPQTCAAPAVLPTLVWTGCHGGRRSLVSVDFPGDLFLLAQSRTPGAAAVALEGAAMERTRRVSAAAPR